MALLHVDFFAETLGMSTGMEVILPQQSRGQIGMEDHYQGERLPTLYLLHGLSDDQTIWQRRTSIERYVAGMNLAVVMPTVHRGFYTDQVQGYDYYTFVSQELPALCESFFPLSPRREDRFAAGLSMGGYGAMKLGLLLPDRYAAVASLSGALDIVAHIQEEIDGGSPNAPEFVRTFGTPEEARGGPNDLFAAARALAEKPQRPAIYVACGTEDFLYADNQRFVEAFAKPLNIRYETHEGAAHTWDYWDARIQDVLAWLPLQGA